MDSTRPQSCLTMHADECSNSLEDLTALTESDPVITEQKKSAALNESDPVVTEQKMSKLNMETETISKGIASDGNGSNKKATYKIESITLKVMDEARIEEAVINTNKKQTTGSVFSVRINIKKSAGVLAIGIKDLNQGILTVSMLKRRDGRKGPGEEAGLRLGDVILGINFTPTRHGSKTLLTLIKAMTEFDKNYIHLQCWRCHQLCNDPIPGSQFPHTSDILMKAFSLRRTNVFSDWEKWNFIELVLGHMLQDLKERYQTKENTVFDMKIGSRLSSKKSENVKLAKLTDLEESNIKLAKCLRSALCVRIVHTKSLPDSDAVVYVLRVEDIETGLQWVVHRRYSDFHALCEELLEISPYAKDIEFPKKRLTLSSSQKVVESRMVTLEQYIRKVLHLFSIHATKDPLASKSTRHVQKFLGADKYIDCMHPPEVDDQRYIELLAYNFLNDFGAPACQQCVRFVNTVDLDKLATDGPEGYKPVLLHLNQALSEVEQFILQQHQHQMVLKLKERRPEMNPDQLATFVRRCVRRQVEAALFLPLRRSVFRIVFSFIAPKVQQNQAALNKLMYASTDHFMVDSFASHASALPVAIRKLSEVTNAYLPADQGQLLMHAASSVMELHTECMTNLRNLKLSDDQTSNLCDKSAQGHIEVVTKVDNVENKEEKECYTETTERTEGIWDQAHGANLFLAKVGESSGSGHQSAQDLKELLSDSKINRRLSASDFTHEKKRAIGAATSPSRGAGQRVQVDLKSHSIMADPVKTIFTSNETIPAAELYCHSEYAKKEDLSFLEYEQEFGSDPSVHPKDMSVAESPATHRLKPGVFSPSLDESVNISSLHRPKRNFMPLDTKQSAEVAKPGALRQQVSSFSPLDDDADSSVKSSMTEDNESESDTNRDSFRLLTVADHMDSTLSEVTNTTGFYDNSALTSAAVSADDFLPMFTYVIAKAALPHLVVIKEIMTSLVDDEESYGECGYYLATLEASLAHITDMAQSMP